jgi:sugar lactone lactonase YvrE
MQMRWMLACAVPVLLPAAEAGASGGHHGSKPVSFAVANTFVSGQDIPESVTTDGDGNLYISNGNTILRRSPLGVVSSFATLPLPIFALGVKVGPDGCVYNVSTSLSEVAGALVWRICEPGVVEAVAELDPSGGPNDLAFTSDGTLFVTDPVLGRIWKLEPGAAPEVFVDDPLLDGDPANPALVFRPVGVNGIALDEHERFLYLSNTDQGSVLRIDLCDSSHTPQVFVQSPALRGADGIAFDKQGTLFVTVNAQDTLVTVSDDGELNAVAQGGLLDAPSSVVFGATPHDHKTLYMTSSAFGRTLGFTPGTPHPTLLKAKVKTRGLALP